MKLNPETKKHYLKTWPEFFKAIKSRKKRFEIRLNDRDYRVNDILILQEWNPNTQKYTGSNDIYVLVTYVLAERPWVPDGYVCMSINIIGDVY